VVVGEKRAIAPNKVEEVRHLLEVGWHVRVVAQEVHIVEDEVDDMLDSALGRMELTSMRGRGHHSLWGAGQQHKRSQC
jgi:hypothetical protein